MSGLLASAVTAKLSITASSTLYAVSISAPANQRVKILRWGVFFDEEVGDATPAIPLQVDVGKSSASSGGSALTLNKINSGSETVQSTALHSLTSITLSILDTAIVNPQSSYEVIYPMGQEVVLYGGESLGINITSGATISTGGLNAIVKVWIDE